MVFLVCTFLAQPVGSNFYPDLGDNGHGFHGHGYSQVGLRSWEFFFPGHESFGSQFAHVTRRGHAVNHAHHGETCDVHVTYGNYQSPGDCICHTDYAVTQRYLLCIVPVELTSGPGSGGRRVWWENLGSKWIPSVLCDRTLVILRHYRHPQHVGKYDHACSQEFCLAALTGQTGSALK